MSYLRFTGPRGPMRLGWLIPLGLLLWTAVLTGAHRPKRSLRDFNVMISMTTGRRGLDFNGYGNYCGLGGGGPPLDPIDECCFHHDRCYGRLSRFECALKPSFINLKPYTARYRWFIENGSFRCLDADVCSRHACMCDSMAAECFARNMAFYDGRKRTVLGRMLSSLLG